MMGYKIIPPVPGAQPAAGGGGFPTTSVLDTFTDTNGTILENHTAEGGANWVKITVNNITIESNQTQPSVDSVQLIYIWDVTYNAATEVFCDMSTATATGCSFELRTRCSTNTSTHDGYACSFWPNDALYVGRVDDGVVTDLDNDAGAYTLTPGDQLGLRSTSGNAHECYVEGVLKVDASDATYTAGGRLGFVLRKVASQTTAADNFGGGSQV